MRFWFALSLAIVAASPVSAQQASRPTADQVTVQILENEARSYRATIGQLAVQVNELTAKADALGKERDELKAKCGKPCESAGASPPAK
jgi:outer membrane murein-binding lipoprotein Lpp